MDYFMHVIVSSISLLFCMIQVFANGTFSDERIIDFNTFDPRHGVPIDFRYNETRKQATDLNSVPGCPKSVDGIPWIYSGTPAQCYLAYSTGPCPSNSILFMKRRSKVGVCGCSCLENSDNVKESVDGRYLLCHHEEVGRPITYKTPDGEVFEPPIYKYVYDIRRRTCYHFWTQGPCGQNEWLYWESSTDRSSVTVHCLPKCIRPFGGGTVFYNRQTKQCIPIMKQPPFFDYILTENLPLISCSSSLRYSRILQRCIPVRRWWTSVLG